MASKPPWACRINGHDMQTFPTQMMGGEVPKTMGTKGRNAYDFLVDSQQEVSIPMVDTFLACKRCGHRGE